MKIFIADGDVATALVGGSVPVSYVLDGYGLTKDGLVFGQQGAQVCGFLIEADTAARRAVDLYYGMFDGAFQQVTRGSDCFDLFVAASGQAGEWSEYDRSIEVLIAQDVATIASDPDWPDEPVLRAGLKMRARSSVRALKDAVHVGRRQGLARDDVFVQDRRILFARYFDVEDLVLQHRKFDGTKTETITRSVLRSGDAVTVLPYDPRLDQVVLVEQFRSGAFVRGDANPWVLEPVAGRCDGDEPVEEVARREMIEEAGLTLLGLEKVGNYYPSPGCLSEYLYSFVGLVDLSQAKTGVHGLDTENEDIKTHFLTFEQAMALVDTGEAENGPLLLSLMWLANHRTRLRESAGIA